MFSASKGIALGESNRASKVTTDFHLMLGAVPSIPIGFLGVVFSEEYV
jgi:hypothetical protein